MANTVSGPYVSTNWQDGVTQGGHLNMNNLETQSKVALASLNPDLVGGVGFILSGALATRHNAYAATVLADAPLDYYRLDEASGTNVVDLGSLAQNGTTHAAPAQGVAGLLTGDPDTCYTFASASSQYVSLSTNGLPTGAAAFSIEAWVKFAANPAAAATVVWLGKIAANNGAWLYIDTAGKVNFSSDGGTTLTTAAALTTGVAHHLVATYDGTNMRLYVDGALSVGPTAEVFAITYAAGGADIGASAAPGNFWNGQIDEVALYSVALSAARITAHYTNGTTATTQVDIASGTGYLLQSDSTLARCVIGATTETTVTTNTTYYLYLQPDGSWYWSTSNAPAANALAIATVTTDGGGNVKTVTDMRLLDIPLFPGANGSARFGLVASVLNKNVPTGGATTVLTWKTPATPVAGVYIRVSGVLALLGSTTPKLQITYVDAVYATSDSLNMQAYGAGTATATVGPTILNGSNVVGTGTGAIYALLPVVLWINFQSTVSVVLTDTAASAFDSVSLFIERIA